MELSFKDWMLKEDVEYAHELSGDLFIPSLVGDASSSNPADQYWMQWKWHQEKIQGRPFYNIDTDEYENRDYISMKSNTMPSEEWWHHSTNDRPNLSSVKTSDLYQLSYSRKNPYLPQKPMVRVLLPLNLMFKDSPSGKWQDQATDKPWIA